VELLQQSPNIKEVATIFLNKINQTTFLPPDIIVPTLQAMNSFDRGWFIDALMEKQTTFDEDSASAIIIYSPNKDVVISQLMEKGINLNNSGMIYNMVRAAGDRNAIITKILEKNPHPTGDVALALVHQSYNGTETAQKILNGVKNIPELYGKYFDILQQYLPNGPEQQPTQTPVGITERHMIFKKYFV
jgi:hypothetical protein